MAHLDIPIGRYPTCIDDAVGINFDFGHSTTPNGQCGPVVATIEKPLIRQLKGIDLRVKIWPVLAAIRPGNLNSIYLDNCIYMPSVLRRFFIDHSKTLEHVTMNRSYNLHGTFTWVFEEMRDRLSLKSLNLYSFLVGMSRLTRITETAGSISLIQGANMSVSKSLPSDTTLKCRIWQQGRTSKAFSKSTSKV